MVEIFFSEMYDGFRNSLSTDKKNQIIKHFVLVFVLLECHMYSAKNKSLNPIIKPIMIAYGEEGA